MSKNTRSNLDLHTTPISELQYKSSHQQEKVESLPHLNSISTMSTAHPVMEPEEDHKKQIVDPQQPYQMNWEAVREYERKRFKSINNLTTNEMMKVDEWLSLLDKIYDELQYPPLFRVHRATTYFQEEEKLWYEQEKNGIDGNWLCFCDKLKQYIYNKMEKITDEVEINQPLPSSNELLQLEQIIQKNFIKYSGYGDAESWLLQTINQFKQYKLVSTDQYRSIPFLLLDKAYLWYIKNEQSMSNFEIFSKLFLQQFASNASSPSDSISSFASQLNVSMGREIIRTPTYFRGSQDDVLDWLEILEQRFKMANWDDELKLRCISLHLQGDAYKWWIQSSEKINSWSSFLNAIKQAFGSTKMKELAFEQLRCYKQTINQSIAQYYGKIMELCKRIDPTMTDSIKLQYLMAGVKDSLKLHIALHDPQTTESFLLYARKVEDTLSFTEMNIETNRYDEHEGIAAIQQPLSTSHKAAKQRQNYSQNNNRYITQGSSYTSRKNDLFNRNVPFSDTSRKPSFKQSSIICYTCGTPGHYSRDCTRPHFD